MPGCLFVCEGGDAPAALDHVERRFVPGRTGSLRKSTFILAESVLYYYDRIGEMNSSGAARRLRNGQFCRFNSHPARGRKKIPVDKDDNQAFGFNSPPARGQTNRRNFSALHRCSRKVPSVFLFIAPSFQPGMAAEPFSECKTETPETKGQSL